jgi:hypothetical protein
MKCSNGKYKYGLHGNCQFDTLAKCNAAAAAIHAKPKSMEEVTKEDCGCTTGVSNLTQATYLDVSKIQ